MLDFIVVGFLLAAGLIQIACIQALESPGADSSAYIGLAHNIVHAGRYEVNFRAHTLYPPGLPLLLAAVSQASGREDYRTYMLLIAACASAALIAWYFALSMTMGRLTAACCCAIVATAAPCFRLATQAVGADAPYWAMSGAAMLCAAGLNARPPSSLSRVALLLGLVLSAVFAVLVRSVGVSLCVALLAWSISGRWYANPASPGARRAALIAGTAGIVAFAGWVAWTKHASPREEAVHVRSYSDQLLLRDPHEPSLGRASAADLFVRAVRNVPLQVSRIAGLALRAFVAPEWYSPPAVIALALLACGLVLSFRDNAAALGAWYFAAYFGIYTLWPYDEGFRFMLPVAPLAFALIWRGATGCAELIRSRPFATSAAVAGMATGLAAVAAVVGRAQGLQAKVALLFWPVLAIAAGALAVAAKRDGGGPRVIGAIAAAYKSKRRYLAAVAVALLIVVGIVQDSAVARENLWPNPATFLQHSSVDFAVWLKGAADGVVMAEQTFVIHRFSGRRVAAFPVSSDPAIIVARVRAERVRYIMVRDAIPFEYYRPPQDERWRRVEEAYPGGFQMVHRGPGYRVFEPRQGALD